MSSLGIRVPLPLYLFRDGSDANVQCSHRAHRALLGRTHGRCGPGDQFHHRSLYDGMQCVPLELNFINDCDVLTLRKF